VLLSVATGAEEPPEPLAASHYIGSIPGGGNAMVHVYDMDDTADVSLANVRVAPGRGDHIATIKLVGNEAMGGLALIVTDAASVGKILDTRTGAPAPIALIASNARVGAISLKTGATGHDVNGQTLGGLLFDADLDQDGDTGDATALWLPAGGGTVTFRGDTAGEIVTGDVGTLNVFRGRVLGDVRVFGALGTLKTLGYTGSEPIVLVGSVNADGRVGAMLVRGGNTTGSVSAATAGSLNFYGEMAGDLTLSGVGAGKYTLVKAYVADKVSHAIWDIAGNVKTIHLVQGADAFALALHSNLVILKMGDVSDTTIAVDGHVGFLRAWRWRDGSLAADSVGTLKVTGFRRTRPGGMFGELDGVDITLDGSADPDRLTLGAAIIYDEVDDSAWTLTGDARYIGAWGYVSDWDLTLNSGLAKLVLGDVVSANVTINGRLGLAKVKRWQDGSLTAETAGTLKSVGCTCNGTPGDWGADVTVTGSPDFVYALKNLWIGGSLGDAVWSVAGDVRTAFVRHVLIPLDLGNAYSFRTASPLVRETQGGVRTGLIALESDTASPVRFASLRRWPRVLDDYESAGGPVRLADVLASLTLTSLKKRCVASRLGRWTGAPLSPGLMASFGSTSDPTYRFVKTTAFVYDQALAIEAFLQGGAPDAESLARAFQIADALVLLQDNDPTNAGLGVDATYPALTPAPLRDGYIRGIVAASRTAPSVTVRSNHVTTSSGNQAYVASALLTAADAAEGAGDAARAADYRKTARELLLYVGRNRKAAGPLGGFTLSNDPNIGGARSGEHNTDLAMAFGRMADAETNGALQALWQGWSDWAAGFCDAITVGNARFSTLSWISDGWQYFHAGTGLGDDVNQDLVPLDPGAWRALQHGDYHDVAFDFLGFLATSTDGRGHTYTGFDPGFRAVIDPALDSHRDGVGAEVTAYMALIAGALGDTAVLAAFPARDSLAPGEQWAYDILVGAADGGTEHDLADYVIGRLADIQLYAPNTDRLGLVAAPVRNVGTGEYELVNGWSLASTCWARAAYGGWNIFTG